MAKAMLGPGQRTLTRARPFDVYVMALGDAETVRVSHELRLSQAVAAARAFVEAGRPGEVRSVEIWLEGVLHVFAAGSAEIGYCGNEPAFPVSPGRYRWVQAEGADDGAWKRIGKA